MCLRKHIQVRVFLDITIADNGIGVYKSYNKTDKFIPESEVNAIEMAVNGCSTKDSKYLACIIHKGIKSVLN